MSHLSNLLKSCILLLVFIITQQTFAQRERNYIYLLDCTKSMKGYNGAPNIWEPTKNYLKSDIERQTTGTMIHVVPFQGSNLSTYSFLAEKFNWKRMEGELDNIVERVTNTNICDAWDLGLRFIDINKDNYIYLLTDGVDNVKGTAALAQRLNNFCGKYINTRAFYVVLTPKAIDPEIRRIVDNCPVEFFVDASRKLDPFGSFDEDVIVYANTLNLKKVHKIAFSAAGTFPAKAVCKDEYFDVEIEGSKIKDGVMPVKITPKKSLQEINESLPEKYDFTFEVKAKGVDVMNPTVNVTMTNKPERELEIISQQADMGKAEWYDSFIFWGEKTPDTLTVDLKATFNDEAKKDGSKVTLKVTDTDNLNDYKLFFDGQEVSDGIIELDASSMPDNTTIGVVYNSDAKEGKHYMSISPVNSSNVEKINGEPVNNFEVTTRGKYDVNMNPLKVILLWLLAIIAASLILWFLILKHLFFPTFKVGTVMVSDPYFSKIKVKGARKLIFSNKRVEQSMLNRIFTGEVLSNVNACWTQPLVMEPAKKKIRVLRNRAYVFTPYDALLNRNTEYEVDNTDTNEKIKMTIN